METRVALETDFIQLLARLISEDHGDDPPIERTGKDLICSQPILGKWVDECDFPFLIETLALPDHVFTEEFPGLQLSRQDRQTFAQILETHCKECARCHAKQAEDIEWKLRVEKAFAKNKRSIASALARAVGKP